MALASSAAAGRRMEEKTTKSSPDPAAPPRHGEDTDCAEDLGPLGDAIGEGLHADRSPM